MKERQAVRVRQTKREGKPPLNLRKKNNIDEKFVFSGEKTKMVKQI